MKELFATITVALKVNEFEPITREQILEQLAGDILTDKVQIDDELNDDAGASYWLDGSHDEEEEEGL